MSITTGRTTGRTTALAAVALVAALGLAGCTAGDGSWDGSGDGEQAPDAPEAVGPGPQDVEGYPEPDPWASEPPTGQGMTDPSQDALSTFALDIDTGSYTRFRDAISSGGWVDPGEVRTEEFVNYFAQDYPAPDDGLGVSIDATVLPFQPEHRLVRVGIAGAPVAPGSRTDADLALVVDCSGSMGEAGKMETATHALRTLLSALRPADRVALVCYSTEAEVLLEPTPVSERATILAAVDELAPRESTNAAAGLALGYDVALSMRTEGRMNRVVLISDGVANVGETDPEGILARISAEARAGTNLISVGVGITTYDDHLLEQLADSGDGWHVYIDSDAEAERVFGTGLTGSLAVVATDARAQVQFDPAQVSGYRLLGYENRAMADGDFRNDAVDAGEVFAGHATTALYEVALREGASAEQFVTATVRYLDESGRAQERSAGLDGAEATSYDQASPRLRQDLVIALLTDRLLGGPWSQVVSDAELRAAADALPATLDGDADVAQLVELVHRAT